MAPMIEYENWYIGDEDAAEYGTRVADFVDEQVGMALDEAVSDASLFLEFNEDEPTSFHCTITDHTRRKVFDVEDIVLCGEPGEKGRAIDFLKKLIERLEDYGNSED